MSHLVFSFQQAVYEALSADVALSCKISGVYTHVPQGVSFPYLTIGNAVMEDRSTVISTVVALTLEINAFSQEKSTGGITAILADTARLLHQQALSLEDAACLGTRVAEERLQRLSDGLTWQGMQRVTAIIHAE